MLTPLSDFFYINGENYQGGCSGNGKGLRALEKTKFEESLDLGRGF